MRRRTLLVLAALGVAVAASWWGPCRAEVRFYHDPLVMDHSAPREVAGPTPVEKRGKGENKSARKGKKQARKENPAPPPRREVPPAESPWAHDPDAPPGYTPPSVVRRLFENPTMANAKAYLDWLLEQNRRAREVVRLVRRVTQERLAREERRRMEQLASEPTEEKPLITAFLRADCPHCREQAMVLDSLDERGPWKGRVLLRVYLKAGSPKEAREFIKVTAPSHFTYVPDKGLSERLGVNVWPTLYILPPGREGKAARIRGLADHRRLVQVLDRLSGVKGKKEGEEGGPDA